MLHGKRPPGRAHLFALFGLEQIVHPPSEACDVVGMLKDKSFLAIGHEFGRAIESSGDYRQSAARRFQCDETTRIVPRWMNEDIGRGVIRHGINEAEERDDVRYFQFLREFDKTLRLFATSDNDPELRTAGGKFRGGSNRRFSVLQQKIVREHKK